MIFMIPLQLGSLLGFGQVSNMTIAILGKIRKSKIEHIKGSREAHHFQAAEPDKRVRALRQVHPPRARDASRRGRRGCQPAGGGRREPRKDRCGHPNRFPVGT